MDVRSSTSRGILILVLTKEGIKVGRREGREGRSNEIGLICWCTSGGHPRCFRPGGYRRVIQSFVFRARIMSKGGETAIWEEEENRELLGGLIRAISVSCWTSQLWLLELEHGR